MFTDNLRRVTQNVVSAIFLMFFALTPSLIAQNKEMPITASKDALALYMAGREKAENLEDPGKLFEQAVQKDPNFAMAYLSIGRNNQEFRKNLAMAVSLADKVSPGEKEWILAARDQADGNPAGRKQHLDQLVKLYPGDKRAHSQLGFYYRAMGDDQSSLRHFEQATKIDSKYAAAYNNIGYSYMRMGKYAEAESAFKNYIKLIPNNPNPYDSYAELLMKSGKFDESIAQYNKALKVDPTFFNSYRGMGNNYAYKGDYAKARETYQMMYDKAPDSGGKDIALISMMNSYVAEGNMAKAMETNERRLQMFEKESDILSLIGAHTAAGFLLVESNRLDDAAKHFDMADRLRGDASLAAAVKENIRFGMMQSRARLLIAKNEFGPAKTQLDELKDYVASRKNPNQQRGYYETMGFYELGQKNYAKASEFFAKGDTNDPYVWYYRAVAQEGSGDKKGAAELYAKVVDWNQLDDTGHAIVRSRAMAKRK